MSSDIFNKVDEGKLLDVNGVDPYLIII